MSMRYMGWSKALQAYRILKGGGGGDSPNLPQSSLRILTFPQLPPFPWTSPPSYFSCGATFNPPVG